MRISPEGQDITNRFFAVMEILKQNGELRNTEVWCISHNIDRRNLMYLKKNPNTSVLKPELIYYLCNDFSVRTDYIVYGTGDVFLETKRGR